MCNEKTRKAFAVQVIPWNYRYSDDLIIISSNFFFKSTNVYEASIRSITPWHVLVMLACTAWSLILTKPQSQGRDIISV